MAYRDNKYRNGDAHNASDNLDSSLEMQAVSPVMVPRHRKLIFDTPENDPPKHSKDNDEGLASPPYRKVRELRLFDTPATPKTILQKSADNNLNSDNVKALASEMTERPLSLPVHPRTVENVRPSANINPFTPDGLMACKKKRCRTQSGLDGSVNSFLNTEAECDNDDESLEVVQAPKRLALQDTNISRYRKEFIEISVIGVGEFGLVYQCLNRLDGCVYAIKKSIKPIAGSFFEKRALNEVWAHAVLGKHDNVVRYYSAWAEDNHMLIQNEYCNGGSLQSLIQKRSLVESELKILLLHVAEGLRYIHSHDLVHMDLKAGNIFLAKEPVLHKTTLPSLTEECYENGMDGVYAELSNTECIITYKIGDLGNVTSIEDANVEKSDCRYLPNEILKENFSHLFKADMFSLGITLYEAAGGGPLPTNGPEWDNLRNGNIPYISTISEEFNDLIKLLTHPDPEQRPSSTSIFSNPILNSLESKTKVQLTQEILIQSQKNTILFRKLQETKKQLRANENNLKSMNQIYPAVLGEQRCLRSCSQKKRSLGLTTRTERLRDRNKNLISNNNNNNIKC
ncbi:wee1-like protein kinase [Teleopsis dalmanni]|uniref:wee1-like protein kinase n=1 Tax=Teleopsis dalmanni TaxID=139649 RepID=UPI0018CC9E7B|nr:wee1-like protein kinase [Teleopsis dalmanni]